MWEFLTVTLCLLGCVGVVALLVAELPPQITAGLDHHDVGAVRRR